MKIAYLIYFFLSILSFGFISYNIFKNITNDIIEENEINKNTLKVKNIKICNEMLSNETYIDNIYNLMVEYWNLPEKKNWIPPEKCYIVSKYTTSSIRSFLSELENNCDESRKYKALYSNKSNPPLTKIGYKKDQTTDKEECNVEEIRNLKKSLSDDLLETIRSIFVMRIQTIDTIRSCLKAFISDSKGCRNPKYIYIIQDCIFTTFINRGGDCYFDNMFDENVYKNIKSLNNHSRLKNIVGTGKNFLEYLGQRCDNFESFETPLDLDTKIFYYENDSTENSFTMKYYFKAYIDFCKKIKNFKQNENNIINIEFIQNLDRSSKRFYDKFGDYTEQMELKFFNMYNVTNEFSFRRIKLWRNYVTIKNLIDFNFWLTRFSKERHLNHFLLTKKMKK